jgi:hypothetical protein
MRPTAVEVASSFDGKVRFREELGRFVGTRSHDEIAGMFTSVVAGERKRQTISRPDRTLRLGVATAFGLAAVVATAPVFWVFAAGAALFGVWDLIAPRFDA